MNYAFNLLSARPSDPKRLLDQFETDRFGDPETELLVGLANALAMTKYHDEASRDTFEASLIQFYMVFKRVSADRVAELLFKHPWPLQQLVLRNLQYELSAKVSDKLTELNTMVQEKTPVAGWDAETRATIYTVLEAIFESENLDIDFYEVPQEDGTVRRFVRVENENYDPTNGQDPFFVIDLDELNRTK